MGESIRHRAGARRGILREKGRFRVEWFLFYRRLALDWRDLALCLSVGRWAAVAGVWVGPGWSRGMRVSGRDGDFSGAALD
jgi:hypothetical protein